MSSTMNPLLQALPDFHIDTTFVDVAGRPVNVENVIFDDNYDVFDKKECRFTPYGDMTYRGRLYSPKENLHTLAPVLRDIYEMYYKPKPVRLRADFTNYRSQNEDKSSSSSGSSKDSDLPQKYGEEHDNNQEISTATADDTEAAGLLELPINIDGAVPLSQAYQQFEPRGYKLISDWDGHNHQFNDAGIVAQVAAGLNRKRKQYGFSREEVVMFGGISCTPCRPSNLSDPFITTLFRQENFYNTSQEVYDALLPALKLAEKFITDRNHIGYWSTLALGKRVIDMKLTARTKICHERLVQRVDVTDEVYYQTKHLLNRLGKMVEYRFSLHKDFATMQCFGFTEKADRRWNLAPQHHDLLQRSATWPSDVPFPMARPYPKDPWDDGQVVNLHSDFYTAARRFAATKNVDEAARLRFQFWFAVNICHELAHVFELRSAQTHFERSAALCQSLEEFKILADPRFAAGTIEAYWGDSKWAEAGGRWEWQTFGGRIHPLTSTVDASRGLIVFNADGFANVARPQRDDEPIGACIQMSFIEEVQQQSFWSRPTRNLRIPHGKARAFWHPVMFTVDWNDYLKQRDESLGAKSDISTEPADISLTGLLKDALDHHHDDADDRASKRRKIDNYTSGTSRLSGRRLIKNLPRCGRLGQPLIRRYINKADADAKAVREEAMAHAVQEEKRRAQEAATEQAAAEEARRYRAPSPGQKELHDFFRYPGEDPQDHSQADTPVDDYVDPATKTPEDLTLAEKWTMAEEYCCLLMGWEPVEFLAQRHDHPTWRPLRHFNPDDPTSFTQEAIDILTSLRQHYPGQSWPERRATEKALYEQKKEIAQRLAMMDELWTYLGFSRIECHRMLNTTGKGPMGLSVTNFPAYKPMLDALRLTQQLQRSPEYRQAVSHGQVVAGAAGIGLIAEDCKADLDVSLSAAAADTIDNNSAQKITDFFAPAAPAPAPVATAAPSDSEAEHAPAIPPDFQPLVPTTTPEEMLRSYREWEAAGADVAAPPRGLHPTQLLSKALGGSLRTIMPSGLAAVVEKRTREWKGGRKRACVMERADAGPAKRRRGLRDRGKEAGSGSRSHSK